MTEAAVEKHVASIFHKLELGDAPLSIAACVRVLTHLRGSSD